MLLSRSALLCRAQSLFRCRRCFQLTFTAGGCLVILQTVRISLYHHPPSQSIPPYHHYHCHRHAPSLCLCLSPLLCSQGGQLQLSGSLGDSDLLRFGFSYICFLISPLLFPVATEKHGVSFLTCLVWFFDLWRLCRLLNRAGRCFRHSRAG